MDYISLSVAFLDPIFIFSFCALGDDSDSLSATDLF